MLLKTQTKVPTQTLEELEEIEHELWKKYLEHSRRVAVLDDGRSYKNQSPILKEARQAQIRAHRRHQRVIEDILRITRDDLFKQARFNLD